MISERFNKLLKKVKYDVNAFNELYKFYFPKIVIHVSYKYNNNQLGEDVAQDFFVKLLKMEIKENIEKPLAWIYTVCDNIANNFFAKNGKDYLVSSDIVQNIVSVSYEKEIFGDYTEKLKSLDFETRMIIIKKIFEGYTLKEIAEETNLNYVTVRQKYSRGLKKLKKM